MLDSDMRKFLIDTDTASDDAVALLMAHSWPDVQVEAITIVSGNVPVEQGAKNALYTLEMCGASTPVYLGCPKPMLRPCKYAYRFHGEDGMGNMHYPDPQAKPQLAHGVDVIIDTIKSNPGQITLVTLAPLTNIAIALLRAPEIAYLVKRCVIMGGAANVVGNVTPAAEYNIWVDPDAAKIVFHSGMPMEMVGWELSRGEAALLPAEIAQIKNLGTDLARFAVDCNTSALEASVKIQDSPGLTLADPVAMAVALDPAIVTRQGKYYVEVETVSELTRGQTVVDELGVLNQTPNMTVIWSIDAPRWKEHLYRCLG
ncbi:MULTISPECIES: nucleoside hydrolase [unclassified Moorena]|uniref:nucleoside hydrolase n=1 Tax=unclassified Moorena TaxID=2683338 RepID=UPI0025EFDAD3|nr:MULTISPECIES: nucleoside hydrolase [unclassified Moorena]